MVYNRTFGTNGFSCNYGNQTVPTKVDPNGILTAPTGYQVQGDQGSCINWMNNTLYTSEFGCSNGNMTNPQCAQLYKDLGLQTFADQGFQIDTNINNEQILGKQDGFSYTCASFDGNNCLKDLNINMRTH